MFDARIVKVFKTPRLKCSQLILGPLVFYFRINLKESGVLLLDELEKIF